MPAKIPFAKPDPKLLEGLVCPLTGATLRISKKRDELISPPARLAFPIRDGIPIMVVSEARSLTGKEIEKFKRPKPGS